MDRAVCRMAFRFCLCAGFLKAVFLWFERRAEVAGI